MPETLTTETRDIHTNDQVAFENLDRVSTAAAANLTAASAPLAHRPQVMRPELPATLPPSRMQPVEAPAENTGQAPVAILKALVSAQREFTPVAKTKTATVTPRGGGSSYKYQYADWADVLTMALPCLNRHGLFLTQPLRRVGNTLMLVTEIWHENGQVMRDDGLPLDLMNGPQAFGSSLSYQRRYGGCTMLGIQPDADDDAQLAEQDRKEAAELERAKRRTERAAEAQRLNEERAAKKAADTPDEPIITDDQVKEWNRTRKQNGWSVDEAKTYVAGLGFALNKLPVRLWDTAIAWARTKPAVAAEQDRAPAPENGSGQRVATINMEQSHTFFETAKKHGKTGGDIDRFLKERFSATSASAIPVSRYAEALEWATASLDKRPPASRAEINAREGFAALGLNLAEQGALIDRHGGDWEAIGAALDEIARQNTEQSR